VKLFWISQFKDGDIEDPKYRKALVDIFINSIFLYDDKLILTFNWKNGSKTVTFAEINALMERLAKVMKPEMSCVSPISRVHN
jgi:uncharacterized radical SAM superfamily Fe-S cluster-containing enzyme